MGRPKLNRTDEEKFLERRRRKLKHNYKLTPTQYEAMVLDQGGKCRLCPEIDRPDKRLVVDHCHISNRIRGLLCAKCNLALGLLNDDIKVIQSLIDYIKTHKPIEEF